MKTLLFTAPKKQFEAKAIRKLAGGKLVGWHVEAVPPASLINTATLPEVTYVDVTQATKPAELKAMMSGLAHLQTNFPQGSFVLFSLPNKIHGTQRSAIMEEIHLGLSEFPNPERVDVIAETSDLLAKLGLIEAKMRIVPPRRSPLDDVKELVEATADLRVANGNLSADKVAKVFGVSMNQLAGWLGRTRQALGKTPDADSLQASLSYFERVARLRAVVKSEEAFRKWLRTSNDNLDNESPLDLMRKGEWQVMADFVDDMLTGAPT